jgi:hypothetical protein
MFTRDLPEQDRDAVRYVSGLAALPSWTSGHAGAIPEVLAALAFAGLVLWLFWLW